MKKVAVILSGCGVFDGAEIYESVLTLLALAEAGAQVQCFAPNMAQHHVINHITGEEMPEQRNVLVEAARICRGNIQDLAGLKVADFDAIILPGGFGAAKNLSDFAFEGDDCQVQSDVLAACQDFAKAGKAAGYICIAPAMLPKVYGSGVKGTLGNDASTADAFNAMGGEHQVRAVNEICVDEANKVVSTPAYMLAGSILEAKSGIDKLVHKVLALA
ncbi:MAG: isoprenoid biosynthesis glyoxalase ElbB [Pseudomonadota bacterium]|uniref:isoprenoid biosynthesis glyoxalase ElbB n=1 Tax=Gallaecimonas pentaromativorans TaxID=584787 RepID=UPI00067EDE6F|nr:isoprenoid biosynthesis glyoxalase ElbB [Gallaecimonas pentaromativorans]MED5525301.1 isoprenoid biosynthesis glyoxalase ElbB [Pseudomonadota bacterium]